MHGSIYMDKGSSVAMQHFYGVLRKVGYHTRVVLLVGQRCATLEEYHAKN
jgi:hypothetical protein